MSSYSQTRCRQHGQANTRGFVMVAVLVVLTISLVLFGVWAQAAVRQHRHSRTEQVRLQAVRLAEAGVRRGLAQHAANTEFSDENWSVPAGVLDQRHAAEVRIHVSKSAEHGTLRFAATAEYPLGAVTRAQITRQIEIPISEPRDEP